MPAESSLGQALDWRPLPTAWGPGISVDKEVPDRKMMRWEALAGAPALTTPLGNPPNFSATLFPQFYNVATCLAKSWQRCFTKCKLNSLCIIWGPAAARSPGMGLPFTGLIMKRLPYIALVTFANPSSPSTGWGTQGVAERWWATPAIYTLETLEHCSTSARAPTPNQLSKNLWGGYRHPYSLQCASLLRCSLYTVKCTYI